MMNDFYEEIDFELINNLIFVYPEFNGRKLRVLLDTGAPNVLLPTLQSELGISTAFSSKVSDSQDQSTKMDFATVDSVSLGNFKVYNATVVLTELGKAAAFKCLEVDGLLGANFLKQAYTRIDYRQQKLYLTNDKSRLPPIAPGIKVPIKLKAQGTPYMDMQIGNKSYRKVIFDTGSNGGITVEQKGEAAPSDIIFKQYGINRLGILGGLFDTMYYHQPDTLFLQGNSFGPQMWTIKKNNTHKIGNLFLGNYILTFDWNAGYVELLPNQAETLTYQSFGFGFTLRNEQFRVVNVIKHSEAEQKGLAVNDLILSINDIPTNPISLDRYCSDYWGAESILLDSDQIRLRIKKADTDEPLDIELQKKDFLLAE